MIIVKSALLRQQIKRVVPVIVLRNLARIRVLVQLVWRDFRYDLLGELIPMKPRAISFMANDICNARCTMCMIWKRKRDKEISVAEFRDLLNEPFFSKVKHIGITGGEPTLRKDLSELFNVVSAREPRIDAASIITNALNEKNVQRRVLECFHICRDHSVDFSVMVSLDGVGVIHDSNRGKTGNFQAAVNSIRVFQDAGITTSIGCTITKSNVHYVDELLDWAIDSGIYVRFRVAEFIDRLYNSGQTDQIRNFTPLERYQLGLFFHRLITSYETDSTIRKTYVSILGMLVGGKKRSTGCPYHTDTVVVTTRGELLYCSPKSPILGGILTLGSASKVYFGNLDKRREIYRKYCSDCIHDYHVPVSFREKITFYFKCRHIYRDYNCDALIRKAMHVQSKSTGNIVPETLSSRSVLIIGWYGTETAGDKAILWSIIRRLRERLVPPQEITVSSLNPWVSEWTKEEIGLDEIKIVETYSRDFARSCSEVDEIIIGGGPLMDLESLDHMLFAFITAKRSGAITRIEGCGVGPLENSRYIAVVSELFRLANNVSLRDKASVKRAKEEFSCVAELVLDPAEEYVEHCLASGALARHSIDPVVNFFLRKWPDVYRGGLGKDSFVRLSQCFEEALLVFMEELVKQRGLRLNLLPMNTLSDGDDDRVFNRHIVRKLLARGVVPPSHVAVERLPLSPLQILKEMRRGTLNVCMRYHSVLFSEVLNSEFLAIDYTRGGKILGFLADRGKLDRLITLEQFVVGAWRKKLMQLDL